MCRPIYAFFAIFTAQGHIFTKMHHFKIAKIMSSQQQISYSRSLSDKIRWRYGYLNKRYPLQALVCMDNSSYIIV